MKYFFFLTKNSTNKIEKVKKIIYISIFIQIINDQYVMQINGGLVILNFFKLKKIFTIQKVIITILIQFTFL